MSYVKTCSKCGTEFTTSTAQRRNCDGCNLLRHNRSREAQTFIGIDGEGVDRPDGAHEYVMLSVGNKTLWKNGRLLTLDEILSFLWACYTETPSAIYVGFFLGYDFIQWEKQLPERQAHLLLTNAGISERTSQRKSSANHFPDPVVYAGVWEIDIMAGRRFKLRPHRHRRSRFTDACRNRTCGISLEIDPSEASLDGIGELVPGELEWEPNCDPDSALPFPGWETFVPKKMGSPNQEGWLYICDTGSFWQTSFLNVIKPEAWGDLPVVSQAEYDLVRRGKDNRSRVVPYGETNYFEEMARYNVLENEILARVTQRLNEGFLNDSIPIRLKKNEWYGPGRAAQAWMDMLHDRVADRDAVEFNKATGLRFQVGAKERKNERGLLNADVYQTMPAWFVDAARSSYYGGWFEQFIHGHVGDVWEYDINSAYPYIIASLPCLHTEGVHTGSYTRGTGNAYPLDSSRYTILHATIRGSNPYIGCMPYRTRQGNILRPGIVKGWYWLHEIMASKSAGLVDAMDVHEWVSYDPCQCDFPFNPDDIGIGRMYDLRLQVGKNSPAGKALKLVYNSAYGKTAQSVGTPKFSNPVYASLITAGCRTLILEAIASHPAGPSAASMVATDGVYFTTRHPSLSLSKSTLGKWDETFKRNMTQLMPGVYWDDETRERIRTGGSPKMKSRGVSARDLAQQVSVLDGLFARAHFDLSQGNPFQWPTITFKQAFLITSAKLALQRGKWADAGNVQHGAERRISSDPRSKREPTPYRDDTHGGIIRTPIYECGPTLDTTPYGKSFGYHDPSEDLELLDRDGRDSLAYFRDLIN
jgi:DNA polymerase family B